MPYTRRDLAERCGLAPRTLRNYTSLGLLPPAIGHGLAAVYGDEHLVRAVAIGRMRASGVGLPQIAEDVKGWTTAKFQRYVADTDPPAAEPIPAPPAPAPELEGVLDADVPRLGARSRGAGLQNVPSTDGAALPDAAAWSIYPMLSGIALMVDIDAPPVVHRIAAEILAKYGQTRRSARG